jgi:hypothetical protein
MSGGLSFAIVPGKFPADKSLSPGADEHRQFELIAKFTFVPQVILRCLR